MAHRAHHHKLQASLACFATERTGYEIPAEHSLPVSNPQHLYGYTKDTIPPATTPCF